MAKPTRPALPTLVAAIAAVFLVTWSAPSRADIPPSCDAESSLITCAATDVGKSCQGGGQCFEIACQSGASSTKVYRCAACPTIVASGADACTTFANLGKSCGGDGGTGTCGVIPAYCNMGKLACQNPATDVPTGPPSGSTSGGSSGCDIAPNPPKPTAIGLGLLAIGVVAFVVDRLRRRSR